MPPNAPHIVLFVIWPRASQQQSALLERLAETFQLLEIYDISWTPRLVRENLSRLYMTPRKKAPFRHETIRLITMLDTNPEYGFEETATAREYVNLKVVRTKQACRKLGGGNGAFHGANTLQETDYNLSLFLGISYEEYRAKVQGGHLSTGVIKLKRDLTGTVGWGSYRELFRVLNTQSNYVVLRGDQELKDGQVIPKGQDIDFLTDYPRDLSILLGVRNGKVRIAGAEVAVDIRSIHDHYLCPTWAYNVLKTRVQNSDGVYIPDTENSRYSLLYHIAAHKPILPKKYLPLLPKMGTEALNDLLAYMATRGYTFCQPDDRKCPYDSRFERLTEHLDFMQRRWQIHSVRPIDFVRWKLPEDRLAHLEAVDSSGEKLLIRAFGEQDRLYRECTLARELSARYPQHFLKPRYYKIDKDKRYIAYATDGAERLSTLLAEGRLLPEQKVALAEQLRSLLVALRDTQVTARSLSMDSLLLKPNGELILLDLSLAIAPKFRLKEFEGRLRDLPFLLPKTGYTSHAVWQDAQAAKDLLEALGVTASNLPETPVVDHRKLFKLRELAAPIRKFAKRLAR